MLFRSPDLANNVLPPTVLVANSTDGVGFRPNARHIVRAALESIAYQTKDVFEVMRQGYGGTIKSLKADGGACQNNFLMQFQADMLGARVARPKIIDSTVLGAAYLAGVTVGLYKARDLQHFSSIEATFAPKMPSKDASQKYNGWLLAVAKARSKK